MKPLVRQKQQQRINNAVIQVMQIQIGQTTIVMTIPSTLGIGCEYERLTTSLIAPGVTCVRENNVTMSIRE